MATILSNQKSTGSSPYAYYTVTAEASNRTTYGITISGRITSHLASSSSSLGTGPTMGLNAFLTLNGVEQSAVSLKGTGTSWSGTGNHNADYSFTITGLTPTQTSVAISFRVSRTGSAENNYSKGAALKSTACSSLDIPQGVAKSDFNSISSPNYNGTFSMGITSYSGYDVLTVKNGSTVIQTFDGVSNGTAYSFGSNEQATILGLIGASNSSINLTATLETFVSNGGSSLGTTDKTMTVKVPDYTPSISFTSISDYISTYNAYKITDTDLIKSLSRANIGISMSDNYGNNYSSATCNGVSGTINGRTASFSNLEQQDYYDVKVIDSRGKEGSVRLTGNQYGNCNIWTVQWSKGSLSTKVERPSPTGTTANVTVTPSVYDGTNLKSSALLNVAFTFKYTESGSSEVTVQSSSFTISGDDYIYTMQNLDPTKTVAWSISGNDKIGVATNGDSGTLQIGMPVMNAYKDTSGKQFMNVNGDLNVKGDANIVGASPILRLNGVGSLKRGGSGATILSSNAYPIYFRPNGDGDSSYQAIIDTSGNMQIAGAFNSGSITANDGTITMTNNGTWTTIGDNSYGYCHYNTDGATGHWFNKTVWVAGDVFGGANYNERLAYVKEVPKFVQLYSNSSGSTNVNLGVAVTTYKMYIIDWGVSYDEKRTDILFSNFSTHDFDQFATTQYWCTYRFTCSGNNISMSRRNGAGWGDIGKIYKVIGINF